MVGVTEIEIAEQEAAPLDAPGVSVAMPEFMAEIIATFSHICRSSPQVNQRSGVSVRMTVTNYETLIANATRRALQAGETHVVPRVSDLEALMASSSGKIEIESIEEGRDGQIVLQMLNAAVLEVFKGRFSPEDLVAVVDSFDGGTVAHTGDDINSAEYADLLAGNSELAEAAAELTDSSDPAELASAVELILEGLHLSKRLNKEALGVRATYRGRG